MNRKSVHLQGLLQQNKPRQGPLSQRVSVKWESRQQEAQAGGRDLSGEAREWILCSQWFSAGAAGEVCFFHIRGHSARLRDTLDCHSWGVGRDAEVSSD